MNYEDTTHNETPSCPYELTYLVRAEEESALLRRLFEVHGISLEREEQLSKIQLAYPIKGELYAFMGVTRFSASPSALQTLQAALGNGFRLVEALEEEHQTPFNTAQKFIYCRFQKGN